MSPTLAQPGRHTPDDAVDVGEVEGDGGTEGVPDDDSDLEPDAVEDALAPDVRLLVGVGVLVAVPVAVDVRLCVAVAAAVRVLVTVAVTDALAPRVRLLVGV